MSRPGLYLLVILSLLNSCSAADDAQKAVKILEKMQAEKAKP